MKLLAIDTSTNYLSIAISDGDRCLVRFHEKSSMRHSTLLIPMIDRLLEKSKLRLKDIDGFCVSIGPGSFTGLRIGVTTVKGLAFSLKAPIVAVPTLDVIAENGQGFRGTICPVLDARKNKVYACFYKRGGKKIRRVSKYLLLPVKDLMSLASKYNDILYLGDGLDHVHPRGVHRVDWHPRAEVVAGLAAGYFRKKRFVKPEDLEPLYLYSKECDITGI